MEKITGAEYKLDEQLIREIKNHRILYDPSSPGYTNFDMKQSIWKQIANELISREDGTKSIKALKVRWKSLRDAYVKERRYELAKSCGVKVKPKTAWRLKKQLDFLAPFVQIRTDFLRSQHKTRDEQQPVVPEISNQDQDVNALSPDISEKSAELVKDRKNIFNQPISDLKCDRLNEMDFFFQSIAEAVKGLKSDNQSLIQKEIMSLVMNYKLRELEEDDLRYR